MGTRRPRQVPRRHRCGRDGSAVRDGSRDRLPTWRDCRHALGRRRSRDRGSGRFASRSSRCTATRRRRVLIATRWHKGAVLGPAKTKSGEDRIDRARRWRGRGAAGSPAASGRREGDLGRPRTFTTVWCSPGPTEARSRPTRSPSGSPTLSTRNSVSGRPYVHTLRHGQASLMLAAGVPMVRPSVRGSATRPLRSLLTPTATCWPGSGEMLPNERTRSFPEPRVTNR